MSKIFLELIWVLVIIFVTLLAESVDISNNCSKENHIKLWNGKTIICYVDDENK